MPLPAIASAILSSVINAIGDAATTPPTTPTTQSPTYTSMARAFPANTVKGELLAPIEGTVQISGKSLQAAPGLQVRNEQNMIVMPASLQGTLPVRYQLDPLGSVWRIWVLTSAELAASDTQP